MAIFFQIPNNGLKNICTVLQVFKKITSWKPPITMILSSAMKG